MWNGYIVWKFTATGAFQLILSVSLSSRVNCSGKKLMGKKFGETPTTVQVYHHQTCSRERDSESRG